MIAFKFQETEKWPGLQPTTFPSLTSHEIADLSSMNTLLLISDCQNLKYGLLILQHLTQECICRIRRIWNAVCTTGVIHVHWAIIPYQVKTANTLLTASQSSKKDIK